YQRLRNAQADAKPAIGAGHVIFNLYEAFKDTLKLIFRDANAVVLHRNPDFALVADFGLDGNLPVIGREAHRIVEYVKERHAHTTAVNRHTYRLSGRDIGQAM